MIPWKNLYEHLININKQLIPVKGEYYEKHHIVPRYMGGDNSKQNLVYLSFKHHILAHYILWKIHGNLEDKVAYKMMSGQTVEGRILKQQLAVLRSNESNKAEIVSAVFKDKEKVKNIVGKRKKTRYKNNNGNWYSKSAIIIKSQKAKNNYNKLHNKEATEKRSKTIKEFISNMTQEEFYNRYTKKMEGESHPMYGTKRPGELAGNFGTSKGKYFLHTPENEILEFFNLRELLDYGFNEHSVRLWVNKGIIIKNPKCRKPFKWSGYKLEFIKNKKYGEINNKQTVKPQNNYE